MTIIPTAFTVLNSVKFYLQQIDNEQYTRQLAVYSNSTIGQHTRHVIEFFICLIVQSEQGKIIDYDRRQRNKQIETDRLYAINCIDGIIVEIVKKDLKQSLQLAVNYDNNNKPSYVSTTLERELVYNIEHTIHHLALIKIGLNIVLPSLELPKNFGIAPSTIKYQNSQKCAP